MKAFEEAAREAGRALGDLGAGEGSPLVEEVAAILAELAAEPARRTRRMKHRAASSKLQEASKAESQKGPNQRA